MGKGTSNKSKLTTYANGGPRVQVVRRYFRANASDVDVAFQAGSPTVAHSRRRPGTVA